MKITVSGQHMDVGASLQQHVEAELTEAVLKYFEHAVSADVIFKKLRHLYHADVMVNEGTGTHLVIKASAEASDAYAAFDQASERVKKQLRRYKRRIKNHHKTSVRDFNALTATKYVLSVPETEGAEETSEQEEMPVIIAEKATRIETLSVSEAVMRMDLADLPALMFINEKNKHVNVVYRRADGNISWIDSEVKMSA